MYDASNCQVKKKKKSTTGIKQQQRIERDKLQQKGYNDFFIKFSGMIKISVIRKIKSKLI